MNAVLIILAAVAFITIVSALLVIFSACSVSGKISRQEEHNDWVIELNKTASITTPIKSKNE